ncbi:hypothetical protein CWE14_06430 [Aliidiomarina soli]|uniref:Type II secretion system protein GspF domain-containing protein n=1 Tax=Aliidiomarina soli TaxID=1928574 RepID=A0A432WJR1_9GAMM|nr:hypothetical protein CWE14_06430 [Aliidiomarina soli]
MPVWLISTLNRPSSNTWRSWPVFRKTLRAWHWQGRNRHGLKLRGIAFIPPQLLRLQLWQQGVQLISTRLVRQRPLRGKRRRSWQLDFTAAWASLLNSGLSQLDAFRLLMEQAQHAEVSQWLHSLLAALHSGSSLHQSLQRSAAGFSAQYCRLVEVGEQSGQLPQVLRRLQQQMEQSAAQSKAVRKALTYPLIVLAVAVLVVFAMLYFVVPQFAQLYLQMDVAIPPSTASLLALADALREPTSWLLLLPLAALWPVKRSFQYSMGRYPLFVRWVYQLPGIGSLLLRQHLTADFATLQLAYASHLPLTDACQLTARSCESAYLRQHWQRCTQLLAGGSSLYEILQQNPCLNQEQLRIIDLGERSGRLSEQLERLTQQLADQVEQVQQRILKALEPVFLAITGVITGAILMALYIPLFQLGQLVG